MQNSYVERVDYYAAISPNHAAVTAKGKTITYGEYSLLSKKLATCLQRNGIGKGDRVLCRASQCTEFLVLFSALLRLGASLLPVERDCPVSALQEIENDYNVKGIFGREDDKNSDMPLWYLENIEEMVKDLPPTNTYPNDLSAEGMVLFTSGSTGKRKGVLVPVSRTCEGELTGKLIGYSQDTVCYLFAPVNHMSFFGFSSAVLFYGGELIIAQSMTDVKDLISALEVRKANAIHATPSVYNFWLRRCGDLLQEFSSQLKIISMTGEKTPENTITGIFERCPQVKIYTAYGSTETGIVTGREYENTNEGLNIDCVGELWKDIQVDIVNERIVVNTPYAMIGYKDGDLCNGVIETDDRGKIEDGKLYVLGRMSDVIISGGHKIDPLEVEKTALAFGGVQGCVCSQIPDMVLGNALKLYVQWKAEPQEDGLKKHLLQTLESYKIPRIIESVSTIKKNSNGKTDRKYYKNLQGENLNDKS